MSMSRPLSSMQHELNRLFYDFEQEFFLPLGSNRALGRSESSLSSLFWIPPVDIHEEGNEVIACLSVPGMDAHSIDMEVKGNILTVKGESKQAQENKNKNY